jgi:predicted small metal-binding protein
MLKRFAVAFFAITLLFVFSAVTFAQEKAATEQKENATTQPMKDEGKMEMSKGDKMQGPLMSVTCDPACGFMVRSHNQKELISIVKKHAKQMHKMEMTDAQIKEKIKTEEPAEMKKD